MEIVRSFALLCRRYGMSGRVSWLVMRLLPSVYPVAVCLIADTAKGNRPSFAEAAPPEQAEPLYERFCSALRELGVPVETGVFGARMELELVNDGPVTIVLDV